MCRPCLVAVTALLTAALAACSALRAPPDAAARTPPAVLPPAAGSPQAQRCLPEGQPCSAKGAPCCKGYVCTGIGRAVCILAY